MVQLEKLNGQYESNPYPTTEEKAQISLTTKLLEKQVNFGSGLKEQGRKDTTAPAR